MITIRYSTGPDANDWKEIETLTLEYIGNNTRTKGPAIVAGGLSKTIIHVDDVISINVS